MHKGQQAVLGAILALPFLCVARSAGAAPPQTPGHYVYVPAGATVVVLPRRAMTAAAPAYVTSAPMGFPVASMIAQQDAMMQQMIADMNAMFATPMPDPQQVFEAAMRGMPQPGAGADVFLTSVSSGNGVCSETITYDYPANGGKPQVHVARSGNGCGAVTMQAPASPVAAPIAPRAIPNMVPPSPPPRVWTARDTARPIGPANRGT
jgi:hypothetical protein